MQTGLLERSVDDTSLVVLFRVKRGVQVELETLCNLVVKLNAGPENIGGGPGLGESKTVLGVGVLALKVTGNGGILVVAGTGNLESDV